MTVAGEQPARRWRALKTYGRGSRKWLLGLGILTALAFTIFFGVQTVQPAYKPGGETIQPWIVGASFVFVLGRRLLRYRPPTPPERHVLQR